MYTDEQQNMKEQIVNEYGPDLDKLTRYLTWFESKSAVQQNFYRGEGNSDVIPVPVYDSTLLSFVKEAKVTKFMDKNYMYIYRRYNLKTPEDERKAMANAKITDIDLFKGILSKYIKEGQIKALVWTTGLNEQIFVSFLRNLNKVFYDHSNDAYKYTNLKR